VQTAQRLEHLSLPLGQVFHTDPSSPVKGSVPYEEHVARSGRIRAVDDRDRAEPSARHESVGVPAASSTCDTRYAMSRR
jgi:hypothetical protein